MGVQYWTLDQHKVIKQEMDSHIGYHENSFEIIKEVPIYDEPYISPITLVGNKLSHIRRAHNKLVQLPFDTCDEQFANRTNMAPHQRSHNKYRWYKQPKADR